MPRLINVEKLEEYKADCCVSLTEWQEGWNDAIDMIMSETPTVEALPIEWIKSKKIEYEHDRYDYVRGCFDGFNDCIDYLIDGWEKENETDR